MKGIELAITDDDRLAIRCLDHDKTHIGTAKFCCADVMIRAMSLAIKSTPTGYHARAAMEVRKPPTGLAGFLFDLATTPLLLNPSREETKPIE